MDNMTRILLSMLLVSSLACVSGAYVTQIHATAVLEGEQKGLLSTVTLNVTPGNGSVSFDGNASINESTLASAQAAVQYASLYTGMNASRYNFTYDIENATGDISGPSGGLAFTLLAVSGLERKPLMQDFAATGTIQPDGAVGLIGGIYDKIGAASKGGMEFMLVPMAGNSSMEALLYYLSQQGDAMPVVEVSNVSQAIPYAFGSSQPSFLNPNFTQEYNITGLPVSAVPCTQCNTSAFGDLVNATLGYTGGYAANLSANFSAAKEQLLGNLQAYKTLETKGYLYTAADLAFLDFPRTFTLYNARDLSKAAGEGVEANVSAYCASLTPPQLTDTNYEFVTGGNLRYYWAEITLNESRQDLSSVETTDDVAQSVYESAEALGWCKAAGVQYQIASSMGGNYVTVSQSVGAYANSLIAGQAGGLYGQSAQQAYANGDYATALYAAVYQRSFGSPIPNLDDSQMAAAAERNIGNATVGTWPSQFAAQAQFYLNKAALSDNASVKAGYLDQAYTTSELASGLAAADARLSVSLAVSNGVPSTLVTQRLEGLQQSINDLQQTVGALQQQLSEMYFLLLVVLVLLFALLLGILGLLVGSGHTVWMRERTNWKPEHIRKRRIKR